MSPSNEREGPPVKRRKLARARPQHMRGVNIKPNLATAASQSLENVVQQSKKASGHARKERTNAQPAENEGTSVPPTGGRRRIAVPMPIAPEVDVRLEAKDCASKSLGKPKFSPVAITPAPLAGARRTTRASVRQAADPPAESRKEPDVAGERSHGNPTRRKRKRPDNMRIKVPDPPADRLPKLAATPTALSQAAAQPGLTAAPEERASHQSPEDPDAWVDRMIKAKPKLKTLTATGMTVDLAGVEATIRCEPRDPKEHVGQWLENSDFAAPLSQMSVSPVLGTPSHVERPHSPDTFSTVGDAKGLESASSHHSPTEEHAPAKPSKDPSSMDAMTESGADEFKPAAMRNLQHVGRGAKKGPWSVEEIQLADDLWNDHVRCNNLRDADLRLKTIQWSKIGAIKQEMYEAFPDRTLETIRKFCQRHFTPYKSGPWTEEEDELLRHEYALHPAQWTLISGALMRSPQCVRDRWRNNTQDHATRLTGAWTEEEEQMLGGILRRLWDAMSKDPTTTGKTEAEIEASFDWNLVNSRMGGTRSARRCYEKWQIMKIRLYAAADPEYHAPSPAPPPASASHGAVQLTKTQRALENRYKNLGWGDVLDALADITVSMGNDLDQKYRDESTFWSEVAMRASQAGSKFAGDSKMRRRCYEGALVKVGYFSEVTEADGIARKAEAMQNGLLMMEEGGRLTLERKYESKGERKEKAMDDVVEKVRGTAEVDAASAQPEPRLSSRNQDSKESSSRRPRMASVGKFCVTGSLQTSSKDKNRDHRRQQLSDRGFVTGARTARSTKKRKRREKMAEMKPQAKKQWRTREPLGGPTSTKRLSEAIIVDSDED